MVNGSESSAAVWGWNWRSVGEEIAKWALTFLLAFVIKTPVTEWWRNRGELRKVRVELYEMVAELQWGARTYINLQPRYSPENEAECELVMQQFYASANPDLHRSTFLKVQSRKRALGGEAAGLIAIWTLLNGLPGPGAKITRNLEKVPAYMESLNREIALSPFDDALLAEATRSREKEAIDRMLKESAMNIGAALRIMGQADHLLDGNISIREQADALRAIIGDPTRTTAAQWQAYMDERDAPSVNPRSDPEP